MRLRAVVLAVLVVGSSLAIGHATPAGASYPSRTPESAETGPGADAAPGNGNIMTDSIAGGMTAAELANTLAGSGVTVANAVFTGASAAGGLFNATSSGIV